MKLMLEIEIASGVPRVELVSPDHVPLCEVEGLSVTASREYAKQMVDYAFDVLGA